ncbi:hypothetical protein BDV97DRAFT_353779 [Delphinella strobiligena]|nr:hypothetical protein BDV97DRAFT_353779 [Delphinella strobiligena]
MLPCIVDVLASHPCTVRGGIFGLTCSVIRDVSLTRDIILDLTCSVINIANLARSGVFGVRCSIVRVASFARGSVFGMICSIIHIASSTCGGIFEMLCSIMNRTLDTVSPHSITGNGNRLSRRGDDGSSRITGPVAVRASAHITNLTANKRRSQLSV